ncbi:UDP-GalNAc:beta-1,3-N-acetylgalactosaminyltransferase 2 [Patella vulgata]|uniref:UDP-GalNAc:beta-1, 3-N-acetylgalactosaminyltransferase 2 n=1 Tax=Patella vulgata TaxID=6465 RepID=UPI002180174F|nr:UDP-GalNAc:beta-1,3-N-acetylgalactosaminyltransferase 2 [Patella vulgata]
MMYMKLLLMISVGLIAVEFKLNIIWNLIQVEKERVDLKLAVCVLSARENFKQRQTLRETWFNDKYYNNRTIRIKSVFVVGRSGCCIHPENRLDPFDCKQWYYSVPDNPDNIALFQISNKHSTKSDYSTVDRLWIKVQHPVRIKRLGIANTLTSAFKPELLNSIRVGLATFDQGELEEVVSVQFSYMDPGILHNGYNYQPITERYLPKDLEYEIYVEGLPTGFVFGDSETTIMHDTGAVVVEGLTADRTYINNSNINSLISFMFNVDEIEELRNKRDKRDNLDLEWQSIEVGVEAELSKEMKENGDILLVDTMDVYRNLPKKLLACHRWFYDKYEVHFVLKTDDDCFVDIRSILNNLHVNLSHKLWLGHFRNDWLVQRSNKWRERYYTSQIYPKFACGSGNVVSSDVHRWLAGNHLDLFAGYQGEDTAMGIWLSALGVKYEQHSRFVCDLFLKCSQPFVVPNLNITEIQVMWDNNIKCGFPSGCSCKQTIQ